MRKVLRSIQSVTLCGAVCSLFVLLFVLGDTDAGALATNPGRTLSVAMFAGVCALVGGVIHWVGLPALDELEERRAKDEQASKE